MFLNFTPFWASNVLNVFLMTFLKTEIDGVEVMYCHDMYIRNESQQIYLFIYVLSDDDTVISS